MSGRLTEGFREIIELRWDEFVAREKSYDGTNFDSIITGLVRACKKGNLRAIQVALDRLDGKIALELEIEYPKFYTLYPYAKTVVDDPNIIDVQEGQVVPEPLQIKAGAADLDELVAEQEDLPTGSLRSVLERMLDSPKQIVTDILESTDEIDKGTIGYGNPLVKSVIVAGLMKLVHDGRISAVFEVFDQIDGKVADKFKVLGDDVFIRRYDAIAPAGAVKNADGIYQIAADNVTNAWVARLEQTQKNKGR